MRYYIYELLEAPCPANERAAPYDINEHPDAFPIAGSVDEAEDREALIARFDAWPEENRLGTLSGEMFTIGAKAAGRNPDDMRQACEFGFRTAVQMIMAGLPRPTA